MLKQVWPMMLVAVATVKLALLHRQRWQLCKHLRSRGQPDGSAPCVRVRSSRL